MDRWRSDAKRIIRHSRRIGDSDIDTGSEIELEDNDLIVGMSTDSGSDSDGDNN